MRYLTNALSLQMFPPLAVQIVARPVALAEARQLASTATSAVGHAPTARLFASLLDRPVATARLTLELQAADTLLVGQYVGPRLEEGATELPEGASLRWVDVSWSALQAEAP